MNKLTAILTGITVSTLLSTPVIAEDYEPEDLIKYRHMTMEAFAGHQTAVKLILEGRVAPGHLDHHVAALENLFMGLDDLFPEGSDFGETDAKEAIWENPEKFARTVKDSKAAFAEFKAVLAKGDNKASLDAFKKYGKNSCGSCHKAFKKEDD